MGKFEAETILTSKALRQKRAWGLEELWGRPFWMEDVKKGENSRDGDRKIVGTRCCKPVDLLL